MVVAQVVSFGSDLNVDVAGTGPVGVRYWMLTSLIVALWWIALWGWGSRDTEVLGAGVEEYKRVTDASLYLFGGIAIVSYALDVSTARGYVAVALPLGLLLLLLGRRSIREFIGRRRRKGHYSNRLMLIGGPASVEHLNETLTSTPEAGYRPVAAILPGFRKKAPNGQELPIDVVSVSSDLDEILAAVDSHQIDAIAITSGSLLKPRTIRRLGWELKDRGVSMILAPALTDVAGPRIHTQPVAGLPLVHVSTPRLEGGAAVAKRVFDVIGSGLALVVLSPFLLLIAALVKLDSPGPVFFHQERIGKDEAPFTMHKFRSMVAGAERQVGELMEASGGAVAFFKIKDDPRITRFGAFIRKFSIDELPQLWNVLVGDMSMVGPRPQVRAEVDTYGKYDHRRLMVKPGITGLWQVSGRNDLSLEDSVRLDLYYVENWSLMQDLVILLRTVRAVFIKDGAY